MKVMELKNFKKEDIDSIIKYNEVIVEDEFRIDEVYVDGDVIYEVNE